MVLDQEMKTYKDNISYLIETANNLFVLIKNTNIIGTFETYNDAAKFAYSKYGNDTFLIKQVQEFEYPLEFTSSYFDFQNA